MSDTININDDLLNYDDDDVNEDELLLSNSDEEISQQDEDLLLDDDELLETTTNVQEKEKTKCAVPQTCIDEKIDKQIDVIEQKNIDTTTAVVAVEDVTTVSTTKPNITKLPVNNNADSSSTATTSNDNPLKVVIKAKESEVTTTNKTIPTTKLTRPLLKRKNVIDSKKSAEQLTQQKEKSISPTKPTNSPIKSATTTQSPVQIQQILPSSPTKSQKEQQEQLSANVVTQTTTVDKLQHPKNDEVSSTNTKDSENNNVVNTEPDTNKVDEQIVETSDNTQPQQQQQQQEVTNQLSDEKMTTDSVERSSSNDDYVKSSQDTVDSSDNKREDDSVSQSQQSHESSSVTTYDEIIYSSEDQQKFETEDSDDDNERLNPKTCVEREERWAAAEDANRHRQQQFNRQQPMVRGAFMGGPRPTGGQYPPHYNPFQSFPPNENFNPTFQRPPIHPSPGNPQQMMHRMEFRNTGPYGFPPQQYPPNDLRPMRPPMMRLPRQPNMPPFRPFNGHMNIRPGNGGAQIPPPIRYDNSRPRQPSAANVSGQPFMPMRHPQFIRPGPGNVMQQQPRPLLQQQQQQPPPQQPQPPQQQHSQIQHGGPPQQTGRITTTGPLLMPTKVLINPNFKGGVEAVTNKLRMESQYFARNENDAELLRKQEAFINQNRMHIEKRRYERSPERDRVRERSYSPPVNRRRAYSRERDNQQPVPPPRRPYNNNNSYRGGGNGSSGNSTVTTGRASDNNRGRRAVSKDHDNSRQFLKRRRSNSMDRDDDRHKFNAKNNDDQQEDEETRAYRQEIEKQKSMREKILRDKEMRRRKAAAETKKEVDDKKQTSDESSASSQKFAPIIVTEKKIISLKKKSTESSSSAATSSNSKQQQQQHHHHRTANALSNAKHQTDTKRHTESKQAPPLATVKPVVKQTFTAESDDDTLEDYYDEDELLADSPSPPPTPPPPAPAPTTTTVSNPIAGKFTNRRVILKQSSSSSLSSSSVSEKLPKKLDTDDGHNDVAAASSKSKGIFDRLDRRMGVNENAKRKIQRIVINNNE